MRPMLFSRAVCGLVCSLIALDPAEAATARTYTFDLMESEQPAAGFTAGITRRHGTVSSRPRARMSPVWCAVLADASAPTGDNVVRIISGNQQSEAFRLCLLDGSSLRDVDLSIRFKPVSGKLDRAAGLVLRARDADTYYVARANALEHNVRFYRVIHGRRTLLAGRDVTVPTAAWQTLRVRAEGPRFAVYLDGRLLFEASDRSLGDAGQAGFWVKSDSVTLFDDFAILPLDR